VSCANFPHLKNRTGLPTFRPVLLTPVLLTALAVAGISDLAPEPQQSPSRTLRQLLQLRTGGA
jgi:hypothetical protein